MKKLESERDEVSEREWIGKGVGGDGESVCEVYQLATL